MSNGVSWANQYDAADQLTAAAISDQVTTAMLTNNAFAYDRVGNRLSKQQNSSQSNALVAGSFNNLNQLTSLIGGNGQLQVSGSISKTSKVTVVTGTNSYPATTLWGTNFAANIPASLGSNTFSVVAQDANTNLVTNTYQINVEALEGSRSVTYDANGNCLSDGQRSYTWDAANRLASLTLGTNTYAFGYDFAGRRISEKLNGTLIKQTLWDSAGNSPTPLEERSASNTVTKRFFAQGEQQGGTNYFYLRDHLGSVREMVNASGSIVSEAIYDPYGVATVSGSVIPSFQYAGYYAHQGSGLNLTWYRSYDPVIGRWQARDPIGYEGGINLYGYVSNNPVNFIDPDGKNMVAAVVVGVVVVAVVAKGLYDIAVPLMDYRKAEEDRLKETFDIIKDKKNAQEHANKACEAAQRQQDAAIRLMNELAEEQASQLMPTTGSEIGDAIKDVAFEGATSLPK